jgi:hypothetical protein
VARKLMSRPDQTVIVTLGSAGVATVRRDEAFLVEGRKVKAIDTTGAGDCFCGALAAGLSAGMDLREAVEHANAAAALSVQKPGARRPCPAGGKWSSSWRPPGMSGPSAWQRTIESRHTSARPAAGSCPGQSLRRASRDLRAGKTAFGFERFMRSSVRLAAGSWPAPPR